MDTIVSISIVIVLCSQEMEADSEDEKDPEGIAKRKKKLLNMLKEKEDITLWRCGTTGRHRTHVLWRIRFIRLG